MIGWMDTWRVGCKYGWEEQEIQQRSRGVVWTVGVCPFIMVWLCAMYGTAPVEVWIFEPGW